MGLFGLFSLKAFDHEAFEKELTSLTQSISASQRQIQQLKNTHRAVQRTAVIYACGAYIAMIGFLYLQSPHEAFVPGGRSKFQVFLASQTRRLAALMVLFPVVAYVVIFVANRLFTMLINRRERVLAAMKKKHSHKIDELKKITNFNRTNELLTKYGNDKPQLREAEANKLLQKNQNGQSHQKLQQQPSKGPNAGPQGPIPSQGGNGQFPQNQRQQHGPIAPGSINPPVNNSPSFLDRLLDYIIGSDSNESVENRHALICARCFNHNGLAPPNCKNPFEVTYICPHCGYVNGETLVVDQPANEEGVDTEGEPGIIPEEIHGAKHGEEELVRPQEEKASSGPQRNETQAETPEGSKAKEKGTQQEMKRTEGNGEL